MKHKKTYLSVKKAIGHLNKVLEMIKKDIYCIDVMQQMNAAVGHLRLGQNSMLEKHFDSCAVKALSSGNDEAKAQFIKELLKVFNRK